MAFQKLGGQSRFNTTAARGVWIANSPVWKVIDQLSDLDQAIAAGHTTIWRHYFDQNSQAGYLQQNGATFADQVIQSLQGRRPTYIEGFNEVAPFNLGGPNTALSGNPQADGIALYCRWMREFTDHAHGQGFQVIGFNFGVGTPQLKASVPSSQDWAYIASQGFCGVNRIGLHQYWDPGDVTDTWTGLRHRRVHDELVSLGAGNHPPLQITECGRTNGWKGATDAATMIAEFTQFDQAISQDSYVEGAQAYISGGGSDFAAFEIDDLASIIWGGIVSGGSDCSFAADCQATYGDPFPGSDWICQGGSCVQQVSSVTQDQGISPLVVAGVGLLLGGALYAVLGARAHGGVTVQDVRRIPLGAPVPPGYTRIG